MLTSPNALSIFLPCLLLPSNFVLSANALKGLHISSILINVCLKYMAIRTYDNFLIDAGLTICMNNEDCLGVHKVCSHHDKDIVGKCVCEVGYEQVAENDIACAKRGMSNVYVLFANIAKFRFPLGQLIKSLIFT